MTTELRDVWNGRHDAVVEDGWYWIMRWCRVKSIAWHSKGKWYEGERSIPEYEANHIRVLSERIEEPLEMKEV